jgi:hypothetical protein
MEVRFSGYGPKKTATMLTNLRNPKGRVLQLTSFYYEETHTSLGDGKSLRIADSLYLNPTTRSNFYLMYKSNSKEYAN